MLAVMLILLGLPFVSDYFGKNISTTTGTKSTITKPESLYFFSAYFLLYLLKKK